MVDGSYPELSPEFLLDLDLRDADSRQGCTDERCAPIRRLGTGQAVTGTTLYVSNLPASATEKELAQKFGCCGSVVVARIMLDASTGRSKRFGFVEMVNREGALAAIRKLNLTTYDGRLMSVNLARPGNGVTGRQVRAAG
jgi:hypothetical protein